MIATQTNISKTKTRVLTIFAIGALFVVLFLRFLPVKPIREMKVDSYEAVLKAGDLAIPVSIADTPEEQEQGLSGTTSLAEGTGKLFVFSQPDRYGFWMKDMHYPIDIVWITASLRIVSIEHSLRPESYPSVVYPPEPVLYVLEVPAGFSTTHHLTENQLLTFSHNLSF